MSVSVIDMYSA